MCWKTGLRTVGILGILVLSPFTPSVDGRAAATVCASAVDDCVEETGSICWKPGGVPSLDNVRRNG